MHQNSLVQEEWEFVVVEAIVTKEVTETDTAPDMPVKSEPETVLVQAIVTEEVTKLKLHQNHQLRKN